MISIDGLDAARRDRVAGNQAAAADRHDQHVEVGRVLQHFERDRALAGDDVRIVVGMDPDEAPARLRWPRRAVLRLSHRLAVQHHASRHRPSVASIFTKGVVTGITMVAGMPSRGRDRRPPGHGCRPTSRSRRGGARRAESAASFTQAPRSLNELVTCRFSYLTKTSRAGQRGQLRRRQKRRAQRPARQIVLAGRSRCRQASRSWPTRFALLARPAAQGQQVSQPRRSVLLMRAQGSIGHRRDAGSYPCRSGRRAASMPTLQAARLRSADQSGTVRGRAGATRRRLLHRSWSSSCAARGRGDLHLRSRPHDVRARLGAVLAAHRRPPSSGRCSTTA